MERIKGTLHIFLRPELCIDGCDRKPLYGVDTPERCRTHRRNGDVRIHKVTPKHNCRKLGCPRIARYGVMFGLKMIRIYCKHHRRAVDSFVIDRCSE